MKKDTGNKIKLGIFISLGIVLFIAGVYYIGERQQLFSRTFRVSGIFEDVGGLQVGNNVRFSGINVGTVETISVVSDTSVSVEILIEETVRKFIKKDAVVSIGSEGLMGNKILIITPGTGGKMVIEDNDIVQTVQPINLDDILTSLKTTVENTSNITSDLAKMTGNLQSGKGAVNMNAMLLSIKTILDNTSNITTDVSKISNNIQSGKGTIGRLLMDQSWRQNIDSTIVNLKQGSEGLRILLDVTNNGIAQNIDSTIVNLKQGSEGLKNLLDVHKGGIAQNVDSTFINIRRSSENLNEGLAGLKSLMDSVNSSYTRNIDSTFINLKKGSLELRLLLEKAKHSWLLWGF